MTTQDGPVTQLLTEEQFMEAMSAAGIDKLEGMTVEQVACALCKACGIVPPAGDQSLEQYCHRMYEDALRDPEYQRAFAMIDACSDCDDNLDAEKLRRILVGEEPFGS